MISAATSLYGSTSCQTIAVTQAWYAVGVGAPYSANGSIVISDPSSFCTTANYTVNAPAGSNITWSVTPSGLASLSCTNCSQTTLTKLSAGTISLAASVNSCGNSFPVTKSINVGQIAPGPIQLGPSTNYDFEVYLTGTPVAPSFNWYKNNVLVSGQHGSSADIIANCGSYVQVGVEAVGTCGTSTRTNRSIRINCNGSFAVAPNPTSGSFTITSNSDSQTQNLDLSAASNKKMYEVRILDQSGNIRKRYSYPGVNQTVINALDLTSGPYILQIYDGSMWSSISIIIAK